MATTCAPAATDDCTRPPMPTDPVALWAYYDEVEALYNEDDGRWHSSRVLCDLSYGVDIWLLRRHESDGSPGFDVEWDSDAAWQQRQLCRDAVGGAL